MGPSNDKSLAKSTALHAIDWLDEHDDTDGYHFKICEPRINDDSEYQHDLAFYLRNISHLVALDEFRLTTEDSTRIVKVRLRLSAVAVQQNMTLEAAIRTLCKSMMTAGPEGGQIFVKNLTRRSIWGIIPISEVFRAYWTASFFNKILTEGPREFSSLAEDIITESRPYLCPTLWRFMVFAFAALAGLHDCFHLMQHFYDIDLEETFNLQDFIKEVLPTVRIVLTFFSQRTSAGESLDEERAKFNYCIQHFTRSYDEVLDRFGRVQCCLCKMSNAASSVLVLRRDLLNELMGASTQTQNDAIKGGVVALGSLWVSASKFSAIVAAGSVTAAATAAGVSTAVTLAVPIIACGVVFRSAIWAWDSQGKNRELTSQSNKFQAVFNITTVTWTSIYHMRLALEWFRLHEGEDPSALQFPNPAVQGVWQTFIDSYNTVTRGNNVGSFGVERLLSIWINEQRTEIVGSVK
ncbi:general substrate transporter [Fusarium beomiforme]|uniref:General substrate transporter n=1 Tax=Fusarium beomiforme TaxID=44412 RepID=A0A9P5E276_9HYPO|nr:general substrate transporter [Fusarium beomiforme]